MLETEIKKLTAAIENLIQIMGKSETTHVEVEKTKPAPETKSKPEPMATEDLTRLCLGLSRDGHKDAIKAKLSDLGAERISKLEGAAYEAFTDWAIELSERAEAPQ